MKNYILMLEHDAHDREVTQKYFQQLEPNVQIKFLTYSHEVLPFLEAAALLPAVVLLRINAIPGTGVEVLEQIKRNETFRHLPVVVLGENTTPNWIRRCYAACANTVINKPSTIELTDLKIEAFIRYWFTVAELSDGSKFLDSTVSLN